MGTALDALTASQPLTSRRPAAPSLPSFELPPPSHLQLANANQKYPPQSSIPPPPPQNASVGNLLTPTSNHSGDGPGSLQSASASGAASAAQDIPSYSSSYWQNQNSYGYGSGSAPPQPWNQGVNALFPPRSGFSPSLGPLVRNTTSPTATEGMSQPYDMNQLPPFQQPLPVSSPNVPTPTGQQQQQQTMAHTMMSPQGAQPSTAPPPPQQFSTGDPYSSSKSSSTPLYPGPQQTTTPNQGGYAPPYGGPSPVPQGGLALQPPASRLPPGTTPTPSAQPPPFGYNRPPWPSYSLPAMSGPVMTNVHSPNSQMSLMGSMQPGILPGFNSGHVASMQHMYGGHPAPAHGQPGPPNDRPFKCDQCPQSFNRNHDLKRHKRIHLSVKPYPCSHCEKSFSRKDALKVN